MHILLNICAEVNLGDDLFLQIFTQRYPNVKITLTDGAQYSVYDKYQKFSLPRLSLTERIIRKFISLFNQQRAIHYVDRVTDAKIRNTYDAYLILGGSMFMQHDSSVGYVENLYKYYVDRIDNSFIIGANFGPFTKPEFLSFFTDLFSKFKSIVFRDTYSASLFPNNPVISTRPDVVFQHIPKSLSVLPDSVGISVIDLSSRDALKHEYENYVTFLLELTQRLLAEGKSVYLYSFCKAEGDEATVDRIVAKVQHPNLKAIRYNGDIENFLRIYGSMEAIYATRFHAMILGFVYNRIVVPIIYSKKMTQVLDDIKFTGRIIPIENISQQDVTRCIDYMRTYNYVLPSNIREEAKGMFLDFDKFIESNHK